MKITSQFVTSATSSERFPAATFPEVAFLGRSNVGKSSLLNSLVGTKIAHVSSTPGRTRAINFFSIGFGNAKHEPSLMLVDLPGYGYAKISKNISAEWPKFIEPYLKERQNLVLCIVLIDMNIPTQESDLQLLRFLRSVGRQVIVAGTKADKLSKPKLQNAVRKLAEQLEVERILPYSAKTGAGRDELWRALRAQL
jgi:GTP-binding protein